MRAGRWWRRGPGVVPAPATGQGDLPNTPPVAAEGSVRLFAELFGEPQVHAQRWFLAALVLGVANVALVVAVVTLLPLKTVVPYVVETTQAGVTTRVVEVTAYKPTAAMVRAELARWAEKMMTLDPHLTRENLRQSTLLLRGKAVAQHLEFVREQRPFERLLQTPTLVRTVQVSSVDASKDGIAFLFLSTTERVNGEPTARRWRLTVHYTLVTPQDERELLANPAGLAITHFELSPELA